MIYCTVGKCPIDLKEPICCIYCNKNKNCPNACKSTSRECRLSFENRKRTLCRGSKNKIN
ncbi:MAG: hypothetical protein LKE46_00080 [Clostridium sp.]|uniref:hypothetical protein n=1 Tax=Clostridium sp. TaxID=1506 RepID=UPI0025BB287E|nr:hypothetical protein [Clostridium sp.]MCH3962664.1 hypothetical protein [Clostridium sp.]MCI2201049.1 hypothetical protein [Clostridium sp.]